MRKINQILSGLGIRRPPYKIALAALPAWSVDTPPLGLSYVAAALREAGNHVTVLDYNVKIWRLMADHEVDLWNCGHSGYWEFQGRFHQNVLPLIKKWIDDLSDRIVKEKFDAVGFTIFGTSIHATNYAARSIRKKSKRLKLFYGGPAAQAFKLNDVFYDRIIDAAVFGEGERTVVELIDSWKKGKSPAGLEGVIAMDAQGLVVSGQMRSPMPVDEGPLPEFGDFTLNQYRQQSLPIMMSRGCVGACAFCTEKGFWRPYRSRSPENILIEIKRAEELHGVRNFSTADSLLNGHHKNLEALMDLILAEHLDVKWGGYARVDKRLTADLLKKMAMAGCKYLVFGLESGSQKIINLMNKRIDVSQASKIMKNAHEAGIEVHVNLIVGFPGENDADIRLTTDFLKKNKQYIHTVNTGDTLGISQEMAMWNNADKYGLLSDKNGFPLLDKNDDWMTEDGQNTIKIRRQRLLKIRQFLEEHEIDYNPKMLQEEQ